MTRGRAVAVAALAVLALTGATLWQRAGTAAAPGLRLALFPPTWDGVRVFRAIILGGAKPVSGTPIPGAWLVHLDPGQPDHLQGALVTGAGPFVRLAAAACLTPQANP
ncbi:MAG: hypothetical protein NVV74_18880 [Magnetospirillum sp.]|nr:hypothetical protein [Magnetospirillum sp.]